MKAFLIGASVVLLLLLVDSLSGSDTQAPGEVSEAAAVTQAPTDTATVAEAPAPPPPPKKAQTFAVASITDGDTIRLANGKRVRLVQIDAPELRGGECYGASARKDLRTLVSTNSRVRLEFDSRLDRVDQYGRQLAYVFLRGKNVNLALVRRGAAAPWFYRGERGRYADRLMLAARQARAAGRGLWSACAATRLDPSQAILTRIPPPPPPPVVAPPPAPAAPASNCHPSYEGACLDPTASDYDCAGGSGNGPSYTGYVTVVGYDQYGLDADGDGVGCEDG